MLCKQPYVKQAKEMAGLTLVRLPQASGKLPTNALLLTFNCCNCIKYWL